MMKRLPKIFAALTLGGCSGPIEPPPQPDAGPDDQRTDAGLDAGYDAGIVTPDAGPTPWGDAGCMLPSDFPLDAGATLADEVCECTTAPGIVHCYEEDGPRCPSWHCWPSVDASDGGYKWKADGGVQCLC